jgi:hypothetical protein
MNIQCIAYSKRQKSINNLSEINGVFQNSSREDFECSQHREMINVQVDGYTLPQYDHYTLYSCIKWYHTVPLIYIYNCYVN